MTAEQIRQALLSQGQALDDLVAQLMPVIQSRVARQLLRRSSHGRDVRSDVEDLTQEVFLALFEDDGKVLRQWQPERGLSLKNFVGLVSERIVIGIWRSGRRNPWREELTAEGTELDNHIERHAIVEDQIISRELLEKLWEQLCQELSPLGRQLFTLLFIEQQSVAQVGESMSMGTDAVYAWRSRLRKRVKDIFHKKMSENRPEERNSSQRSMIS